MVKLFECKILQLCKDDKMLIFRKQPFKMLIKVVSIKYLPLQYYIEGTLYILKDFNVI